MSRVLLTGAGGNLGKVVREKLAGVYDTLRVTDLNEMAPAGPGEEVVQCDLSDTQGVMDLVEGCDAIVHLGGMSLENTFDIILEANIRGTYNVYEAARKHGIKRVLFASSNHLTGFHTRETRLDATSEMRPDSIYGVSKGFGELLARYYYDQFGIETACVRIGYSFDKPLTRRMMAIWLSFDDFTDLVKRVIAADRVGFAVVYGSSDNKDTWWDNSLTSYLGWNPKDSSEQFANDPNIVAEVTDPNDPAVKYQGGAWVAMGHFDDEN